MARSSSYREKLYLINDGFLLTEQLDKAIQKLMEANNGVGAIGGSYAPGLPIQLIGALSLVMLGYADEAEFEQKQGALLLPMLCPEEGEVLTEESFEHFPEYSERYVYTSEHKKLWVRIVKRDIQQPGEPKRWLLTVCDHDAIHEHEAALIAAKEEAIRANHAKTVFLTRMSHDIRTPMNGILGMAQIALENLDDKAVTEDALQKITTAGRQLKKLIDEVLDMSQLESGHTTLVNEPFHLRRELEQIGEVMDLLAQERGLRMVSLHFNERHDAVYGSARHLRRIVENIASNSIKYTLPGGTMECWLDETPIDDTHAMYTFTMKDSGIGMSEEFQKQMFVPFTRGENADINTNAGASTGLGLSITKELVNLMGGTIAVESALGKGTTFRISIPLELREEEHIPADPTQRRRTLDGVRLLLVEDNELNREIAEYLLRRCGAQVESAENGRAGAERFLAAPEQFDLILMDVMMPVMDGLTAARYIRASDTPRAKTVPIVAMTANAYSSDVVAARQAGMNAHVAKPIDEEILLETILNCLNGQEGAQ